MSLPNRKAGSSRRMVALALVLALCCAWVGASSMDSVAQGSPGHTLIGSPAPTPAPVAGLKSHAGAFDAGVAGQVRADDALSFTRVRLAGVGQMPGAYTRVNPPLRI